MCTTNSSQIFYVVFVREMVVMINFNKQTEMFFLDISLYPVSKQSANSGG